MRQRLPGFMWFVLVLFMLLGALSIGLGVRGVVTTQRFLATASTADGVVVDVDSDTHEETTDYYLVVRFVTASGRVVQFRRVEGHSPPPESVGDSIRVLYDPANPQTARLDTSEPAQDRPRDSNVQDE